MKEHIFNVRLDQPTADLLTRLAASNFDSKGGVIRKALWHFAVSPRYVDRPEDVDEFRRQVAAVRREAFRPRNG